jgi:nicotinate-nucleotide adenylyltransferase
MVKLGNKKKIGILGGTFDPPHRGHLQISIEAKKKYKINSIIWAVTKKNPFKKKSLFTLKKRILLAKNLTYKKKYISVKFYEDKINSNRTIDLINFIKQKHNNYQLYYLMGADSLISFHKWHKWRSISSKCNILVFDRTNYKSKSLNSLAFKKLKNKGLKFINFKKVNISSSKLRKI